MFVGEKVAKGKLLITINTKALVFLELHIRWTDNFNGTIRKGRPIGRIG